MHSNLDKFSGIYKKHKVCLFTGAGVSFTSTQQYRTPGWWELLERIYNEGYEKYANGEKWKSFDEIKEASKDAWKVVDALIDLLGSEDKFQNSLVESLIKVTGQDGVYKRLPASYLNNAPTLNSVITFCSKINYFNKQQCLMPNDKVNGILTINYDWYLEGGATQKYNAAPFKPMVENRSHQLEGKLSVYHLHGYIPYDQNALRRQPLTMSSRSYEALYLEGDTWTKKVIRSYLSEYTTLFVGVSFDDILLVKYLQQLSDDPNWPCHFFLAKENTFTAERLKELEKANIYPIWIKDYDEIPNLLKMVYKKGIEPEDLDIWFRQEKQFKPLTFDHYWNLLLRNKK